jgi:hypothetical protein
MLVIIRILGPGMKRSLLIACILIFSLLVCGCTSSSQNVLPSNKFVAVYVEMHDDGTIISGTYPYPGMAMPAYSFDLPANFTLPANDSLKIFLGVQNFSDSRVRLTVNFKETEVYAFPYSISPEITIDGVDRNGTVEMSYDNKSINITSGANWVSPVTSVWNETNTVSYPPENGTNYTYTLQFKRTWMVENKGVFNKK